MGADSINTIATAVSGVVTSYESIVIGILPASIGLMAILNAGKIVKRVMSNFL